MVDIKEELQNYFKNTNKRNTFCQNESEVTSKKFKCYPKFSDFNAYNQTNKAYKSSITIPPDQDIINESHL